MKRFVPTLILLGSMVSCLADPTFKIAYVANSGTTVASATGSVFEKFNAPHLSGGYTVFGSKNSLGLSGIFTNLFGRLQEIVSEETRIPQGQGYFINLMDSPSALPHTSNFAILGNEIAFIGTDRNWQAGIYSVDSMNGVQLIANTTTSIPNGTGTFDSFTFPNVLNNGQFAFVGNGQNNQNGIYATTSTGQLITLVDTHTTMPETHEHFAQFSYPVFAQGATNGANFAFIGSDKSGTHFGIYLAINGKLSKIANDSSRIPGKSVGYFSHFSQLDYDANTNQLVFIGKGILGQDGVYAYDGKHLLRIADQLSIIPNAIGNFTSFGTPNIENGFVLFQATGPFKHQGIYLFDFRGDMYKLLDNKDSVNQRGIQHIAISSQALSGNQMSVLITFTDGSSGIYTLTLTSL